MTSVTKGKEQNVVNEKKNKEDDNIAHHISTASMSSPIVKPCCKLPREDVQKVASSSPNKITSSTMSSIFSSSSSLSTTTSTTKIEEYSSKSSVIVGDKKIDANVDEKNAKMVAKKTNEKLEYRASSVDDDLTEISMVETPPVVPVKIGGFPIVDKTSANFNSPSNPAVPRSGSSRKPPPNLDERPLILATHLVPSLPMALFEILAEIIETATDRAVSMVYESRVDRPVAKDIVDIAILPASDNWTDGTLLPVSFVFEHRLNKEKNPAVYVDIVVASEVTRNIEEVMDLRGCRCAFPDRRKTLGAAGLLFSHLKSKGENPSFFGNILDSGSQVAALQMVAGKQAEVGVVESPVINYKRRTLPGVDSLYILASLGPLPPYRIMLNKNLNASIGAKIKESLLNVERDESLMERLRPFSVIAFAEYSEDRYDLDDVRNVVTSVPYY